MNVENKKIVAATRGELFDYYLTREWDQIMSFRDFLRKCEENGKKILKQEGRRGVSMSRKQEDDFIKFWDYCHEIRNVAVARCIGCKSGGPLPLYNQIMVIAYAAMTWNARHKVERSKMKKEGATA